MNHARYLLIIVIAILLSGCSGRGKIYKIKKLKSEDKLTGQAIDLSEKIIMPLKVFTTGDKLLIVDYTRKDIFKVFRLPGYDYLYSYGNIGEGPDEYINVNPESTSLRDGIFEFLDLGTIRNLVVEENALVENASFSLPTMSSPLNNLEKISDSLYVVNTPVYSEDNYEHMILNIKSMEIIKKFGHFPNETVKLRSQQEKHIAFHCISTANSKIGRYATFYTYFKRFKIYSETGNLIKEVIIKSNGEKQYSLSDMKMNIIHFAEPFSSESYIYVLHIGKSVQELESAEDKYNPLLTIWDWDGNPIAQYSLNMPITSFTISEENRHLYGISYLFMGEAYQFELPDSLFHREL